MTVVKEISIQNFRCHDLKTIKLSSNNNVITGPNGSGKTSILEAIYFILQGTSFKGTDQELLEHSKDWWKIESKTDKNQYKVSFEANKDSQKKKINIDEKIFYRMPSKFKYPVVLFEPEDLRLLHGSPSRRRDFIDKLASQINPLYKSVLNKYERALKQRNSLLKSKNYKDDDIFVWDIALSEHGAYIINQRTVIIEEINTHLDKNYKTIADTPEQISVHYSHTYIGDIKQKILNELNQKLEIDKLTGFTSAGPHRHDIIFKINNHLASNTASRGEIRTIVLSIKLIEAEIIEKILNQKPVILLDDVFSELDSKRQKALSETIRGHQIIITSTHTLADNKKYHHIKI